MIKINLLPTKKKAPKKVIDLQQQVLLGSLIIVLILIGMFFYWKRQSEQITAFEKEKTDLEARIKTQEVALKEVTNVEAARKTVSEKIDVIEKLKQNQAGPVHLLDEISKALPQGVNLTALNETDNNISIEGEGFTNEDVVRFVDNLKASRFLGNVTLLETTQGKRDTAEVYKYKIQFVYKGL